MKKLLSKIVMLVVCVLASQSAVYGMDKYRVKPGTERRIVKPPLGEKQINGDLKDLVISFDEELYKQEPSQKPDITHANTGDAKTAVAKKAEAPKIDRDKVLAFLANQGITLDQENISDDMLRYVHDTLMNGGNRSMLSSNTAEEPVGAW